MEFTAGEYKEATFLHCHHLHPMSLPPIDILGDNYMETEEKGLRVRIQRTENKHSKSAE